MTDCVFTGDEALLSTFPSNESRPVSVYSINHKTVYEKIELIITIKYIDARTKQRIYNRR